MSKKIQKKAEPKALPPVPKDLDPKMLEKVMKDSDLIVCAKIGAAMRKWTAMHAVKAIRGDIAQYRDSAMLILEPSAANARMAVEMLYDQVSKILEDLKAELVVERFIDKNAKCLMEALVFEEE